MPYSVIYNLSMWFSLTAVMLAKVNTVLSTLRNMERQLPALAYMQKDTQTICIIV